MNSVGQSPATVAPAPSTTGRSFSAPPADDAPEEIPPWERSWFWWRKGEFMTLFWIALIHVLAVLGVVLFPTPGWTVLAVSWVLMFLGGLGTTVGYHRSLAHLSVRMRGPAEAFFVFAAIFNGSGSPATWAATHPKHHANADKDSDNSSPRHGFWWSPLRWLWQADQASVKRWAPDLDTPFYRFFTRWQWAILLASLLAGAPLGWAGFFWIGPARLVFALHMQCFINSIAHMRPETAPGDDSSQNIAWLGFFHSLQGENWHGNHHAKPWSARIGWSWWQVDLGWTAIRLMEMTGLAWKVNRPR